MSSENNSSIPPDEYEVEDILDFRVVPIYNYKKRKYFNEKQYLIKWVGYEETTWEPESNLEHCPKILKAFKKRIEKKNKKKNKKSSKNSSLNRSISSVSQIQDLTTFLSSPIFFISNEKKFKEENYLSCNKRQKSKNIPKINKNTPQRKKNSSNKKETPKFKTEDLSRALSDIKKNVVDLSFTKDEEKEESKNSFKGNLAKYDPYNSHGDFANNPSYKKFGPSFEEVFCFGNPIKNKITVFKREYTSKKRKKSIIYSLINLSDDEEDIKQEDKNDEKINNHSDMSNNNMGSKIESLKILNLKRHSCNKGKNVLIDAKINIIEKPSYQNKYLNQSSNEEIKNYYQNKLNFIFEGKNIE